ncbi:SURF1 family protein [Microbacterium aurantiacum]|uniref:SURF1 family protein n=1 Tax=Microbacterium aurantiacum TaxID=162393 RepID=UPI003F4DE763
MSTTGTPDAPPAEPGDAEVFPPTLREVMLRPQWIALLALCLVIAGIFAWLGQWQLSRAIDTDPPPPGATEQVQPLEEITQPGEYLPEPFVGQRVETRGSWVPGDFLIVSSRFNGGVEGYWVTGQLRLADAAVPTSIAVAVGWAPDAAVAQDAVDDLNAAAAASEGEVVDITGRLISDEGPALPDSGDDPQTITRMSPPALLAQWSDTDGLEVFRSFIVDAAAAPGLVEIDSPAPEASSPVNWLNIFYALEWAIFAGFAFYLWYRLARDQWEKELEDLEDDPDAPADLEGGASVAPSGGSEPVAPAPRRH